MADLLGEKLRFIRLQRHLTQQDVAHQLSGVKRAHIGNVETNQRPPSLLLVLRLANFYEISTDYLLQDSIPIADAASHRIARSRVQSSLPTQFGAKLRHLREQQGLSQIELAQQLGLAAHAHISLLERGHHEPSIDLVIA